MKPLGLTWKWLNRPHHPPTRQTQCKLYLSCYWPDFHKTSKVGFWEQLDQRPTVTVTFVQATFIHIRNISAGPILTKLCGPNFLVKARSRQSQGKAKVRSREGQGKIKVMSWQGQGYVKARSRQHQSKVKERSRQVQPQPQLQFDRF